MTLNRAIKTALVSFAALAAIVIPTTANASTQPTPVKPVRASLTVSYACIAVKVAGAHMGQLAGITGPYTSFTTATAACVADQKSMPTINGTPVRWVLPPLNG